MRENPFGPWVFATFGVAAMLNLVTAVAGMWALAALRSRRSNGAPPT
jgi:hypothetical protein